MRLNKKYELIFDYYKRNVSNLTSKVTRLTLMNFIVSCSMHILKKDKRKIKKSNIKLSQL